MSQTGPLTLKYSLNRGGDFGNLRSLQVHSTYIRTIDRDSPVLFTDSWLAPYGTAGPKYGSDGKVYAALVNSGETVWLWSATNPSNGHNPSDWTKESLLGAASIYNSSETLLSEVRSVDVALFDQVEAKILHCWVRDHIMSAGSTSTASLQNSHRAYGSAHSVQYNYAGPFAGETRYIQRQAWPVNGTVTGKFTAGYGRLLHSVLNDDFFSGYTPLSSLEDSTWGTTVTDSWGGSINSQSYDLFPGLIVKIDDQDLEGTTLSALMSDYSIAYKTLRTGITMRIGVSITDAVYEDVSGTTLAFGPYFVPYYTTSGIDIAEFTCNTNDTFGGLTNTTVISGGDLRSANYTQGLGACVVGERIYVIWLDPGNSNRVTYSWRAVSGGSWSTPEILATQPGGATFYTLSVGSNKTDRFGVLVGDVQTPDVYFYEKIAFTPLNAAGATASDGVATIGTKLGLSAAGPSSSQGRVNLTVGVSTTPLDAAGPAASFGRATLAVTVPLAASGATSSNGTAVLQAKTLLVAAGATAANGTAQLSRVIGLDVDVTGDGTLNLPFTVFRVPFKLLGEASGAYRSSSTTKKGKSTVRKSNPVQIKPE